MLDLDPFRDILLAADPNITKFDGPGTGNYTTWTPGGIVREMSDDIGDDQVQRIYVDRFTKTDKDPIVDAIWSALETAGIPFEYERDYENDTKYHHHIFTCYYSG
jgi:hypothetical protein